MHVNPTDTRENIDPNEKVNEPAVGCFYSSFFPFLFVANARELTSPVHVIIAEAMYLVCTPSQNIMKQPYFQASFCV